MRPPWPCMMAAMTQATEPNETPRAYMICGTPRSGSTLVCEMLSASAIAGRPHSYFREPDIGYWAKEWDVPATDGIESAEFDRSYLAAMREAGTAGTGIFGLRLMWSSLADAKRRLDRAVGGDKPVAEYLEAVFGRMLYIHLSRTDKLGQAVSLAKAEQTGLWHLRSDGSVLEGGETQPEPHYDRERIAKILEERQRDDAAWNGYFSANGIKPLRLTYEGVTAAPQKALAEILLALGLDSAIADTVPTPTAKMADGVSAEWVDRFKRERD